MTLWKRNKDQFKGIWKLLICGVVYFIIVHSYWENKVEAWLNKLIQNTVQSKKITDEYLIYINCLLEVPQTVFSCSIMAVHTCRWLEHEVQRLSKTFYRDARQPEVDFSQSWVCGYAQICGQFVSISVKTLSNTNLVASRRTEREGVTSGWPASLINIFA